MAPGSAHGLRIGPASKIAKKVTAYPRRTLGAMTCPGMEEKTSRCRWPSISTASAAELWSSDAAMGAVASQKHSSHSMSPNLRRAQRVAPLSGMCREGAAATARIRVVSWPECWQRQA